MSAAALTEVERAALLKVRTAGRFDFGPRGTGGRGKFSDDDAAEEQRAALAKVPAAVFEDLAVRGLIEGWPRRLTDLGRAALATPKEQP